MYILEIIASNIDYFSAMQEQTMLHSTKATTLVTDFFSGFRLVSEVQYGEDKKSEIFPSLCIVYLSNQARSRRALNDEVALLVKLFIFASYISEKYSKMAEID